MDTHKSADRRAHLLLDASSLGQKLRWLDEQAANSPATTTFSGVTYEAQLPCTPTVVYTDGPDGVRGSTGVTAFPAPISIASTWNTRLAKTKGADQADEAFHKGKNVILGPGVSSSRTPLAGRTPEYFGEDSLLSGILAAATINGIQSNPREPVAAVVKHYVANEQELDRTTSSSNLDGRTLREVYNMPFQIALGNSDPAGIMCSYNQINAVYACENPILNNVLKSDLGFDGYVVSDFGAVHSTGPSLAAGLDQELNRPRFFAPNAISTALDSGTITLARIDQAAFRVVRAYIKAGLFDVALPTATDNVSTPDHQATSLALAQQGTVLLKNEGSILPLVGAGKKIAVIGPTASNTATNGISASSVCAEVFFGAPAVSCPNPVSGLTGITARATLDGGTVAFDDGQDLTAAAAKASAADVAIVFGYTTQGEFADRPNLSLAGNSDALISAVAAANPNTIVVLQTGSAVEMPWLNQVKGVVEAWYAGDQQGTAIAQLLWGDVNFSGKLPMTFPKSIADLPENTPAQYPGVLANGTTTRSPGDTSIRQVSYGEGLAVGYKWYDSKNISPQFEFGFGLSYTTFGYSRLDVSPGRQGRGPVKVSYTVTNTGLAKGSETSQVYLTLPSAATQPGKRLVGFSRVSLKPGQSQKVEVLVDPKSAALPLSYYDTATHRWAIAPGDYVVQVGSSSRQLPLSRTFHVS